LASVFLLGLLRWRDGLRFAVEQANSYLCDCGEQWTARVQPELEAQRQRLRRLRGRQVEQLELSLAANQRPQPIKDKHRQEKQKAIDGRFEAHERFVSQVMTIDPAPYLKLVAVLHREASDDKTISQPRADVPSNPVG
jgi:hypothetical protein